MKRPLAILFLLFVSLRADASGENPLFFFSIRGSCGETIEGLVGSRLDDGTGGAPDFKNNRPGYTFEVILTQSSIVDQFWETSGWQWSVGVEGPLQITDITLKGTVSCSRANGPLCLGWSDFYTRTELTGSPYGKGPQTADNHGALSLVSLGSQFGSLPDIGDYLVAKIRVTGQFPETQGETAVGRIFFTGRTGSLGPAVEPLVSYNGDGVTETKGVPPLVLRNCPFVLKAVGPIDDFIRCDAMNDGKLDISDAVRILGSLFLNDTPRVACPAAADCNADGRKDISDAIYVLSYLFLGTRAPPSPFPHCGRLEATTAEDCPGASTICP